MWGGAEFGGCSCLRGTSCPVVRRSGWLGPGWDVQGWRLAGLGRDYAPRAGWLRVKSSLLGVCDSESTCKPVCVCICTCCVETAPCPVSPDRQEWRPAPVVSLLLPARRYMYLARRRKGKGGMGVGWTCEGEWPSLFLFCCKFPATRNSTRLLRFPPRTPFHLLLGEGSDSQATSPIMLSRIYVYLSISRIETGTRTRTK